MKNTVVGSSRHGSFLLQSQNLHTVYVIITVYAGRRGDGFENGTGCGGADTQPG